MSLASQLAARRRKVGSRAKDLRQVRMPRVHWPQAQATAYNRELQAIVDEAFKLIKRRLFPELRPLAIAHSDSSRFDAPSGKRVNAIVDEISDELFEQFQPPDLEVLLDKVGESVDRKQRRDMMHQLSGALGFNPVLSEPGLDDVMDLWTSMNVALIKTVPETYFQDIETRVLRHVSAGTRWEDLADEIEERTEVARNRARVIARDQVSKLYGAINMERQTENGITHYFWRISNDNRVRDLHFDKKDQRFAWDEAAGDPADPADGAFPGDAINCIPAEEPVLLYAPALVAYRRWYGGDLTQLVTNSKEPLRCTPNHPVLTQRGWLAAHLVQVGDYLVETTPERISSSIGNPQRGDASAEEVFRSCLALGVSHRIAGAATRFHGDAGDQQVDVVEVEWSLFLDNMAELAQVGTEYALTLASQAAPALGHVPSDIIRFALAAQRSMSSARKTKALGGGGLTHTELHRVAAAAYWNASIEQHATNGSASATHLLGDTLLAQAVEVKTDHLRLRKVEAVVSRPWAGWVHNFETTTGWYQTRGLVVHNCRCHADPDVSTLLGEE